MAMPPDPGDQPPKVDWRAAQAIGARLMAEQAASHGFSVERVEGLGFDPSNGGYIYYVKSSRDIRDKSGSTNLTFDGDTGALRSLNFPAGEHSGDTVSTWLAALHMADVFGLPYRIFVCVLGLAIAMLSVTGIYIWWKKRRARKFSASQRGKAAEAAESVAAE